MIGLDAYGGDIQYGAWIDYAKRFGAMCYYLEHRYYGESWPTGDLSTENLQYLNSQQALADTAKFITTMNRWYRSPKWIVFGGWYTGSLAAWLRLKYPHLVHGAIASSAPLVTQLGYPDYYKKIAELLGTHSNECVHAVKDAFTALNTLLRDQNGQQQVKKLFNLCRTRKEPEISLNDVSNFNYRVATWLAYLVLYTDSPINFVCDRMTNQDMGVPLHRLAALMKRGLLGCYSYKYDDEVEYIQNADWFGHAVYGVRQWFYQTCTEFGFFKTSSHAPHLFGNSFPIQFFKQKCIDAFGSAYNSNALPHTALNTNITFGGKNIDVTNVVFVQASLDPWHPLGVVKDVNSKAPAIFIKGVSQCADMAPESSQDIPELKAAREKIITYIENWLKE